MTVSKKKVGVLISGNGSNLQALLDATADPEFPAEISLVISNRPKARGLERAKKAGVPQYVIDHKDFESREAFDEALSDTLKRAEVDYVCLAGFMRLLSSEFVSDWRGKMMNIHPSLLPAFRGLNVHERTIDAGVKLAGCTVHFVSTDLDAGPIIGQVAVPVLPSDTPESLSTRILEQEHRLYPRCLQLVAEGKARISGASVILDIGAEAIDILSNPALEKA